MIALTTFDERSKVGANPLWGSEAVQAECLERLESAGMPDEVKDVAKAATRFFDIGVRFSDPLSPWTRCVDGPAVSMACLEQCFLETPRMPCPPFWGREQTRHFRTLTASRTS